MFDATPREERMATPKNVPEANCAACPIAKAADRRCIREDGKNPPDCPTVNSRELAQNCLSVYKSEAFHTMARVASQVERAGYERLPDGGLRAARPRIVELVDFARRMGYAKLGFIFCNGLRKEAAVAGKIFRTNGFEVVSASCKVGCLPKAELGLTREDQLRPTAAETMCNPAMQAKLMNEAGVDFNILMGLCVGHDSLALAHLDAPVSILAVKDRLMGHNPLAPLYLYDSYYAWLQKPLFEDE